MARTVKPVEERRQEILETARRLFIANGYKNTSVADITNELGIAQGLLFHYFKSKAALLYAVFDEIAKEEQQVALNYLNTHKGRIIDYLELLFTDNRHYRDYDLLFESLSDDPAIIEYLHEKMTSFSGPVIEEVINRGNADGSWHCEYPRETALFILQGFSGFLRKAAEYYKEDSYKTVAKSILLRVLGAETDQKGE